MDSKISGLHEKVADNTKSCIDGIQYSRGTVAFFGPTHRFLCSKAFYMSCKQHKMYNPAIGYLVIHFMGYSKILRVLFIKYKTRYKVK